ncbi:glutaminyl-peptide cyclotransferase [Flavobacterium sp. RHBU_3]|uniref:glutaminyl-peptide cyclotransferase n=1 Tax=Flavobacterium sp. RHBU_3 TaxID=3391184 RepID=UPI003984ECC5
MHKLLTSIALGVLIISCNGNGNTEKKAFELDFTNVKGQYKPGETFPLTVLNPENKQIDSIVYYLNDEKIGSVKGNTKMDIVLKEGQLGAKSIKALVYAEGSNTEATGQVEVVSPVKAKMLSFDIVNTYPHDTNSYTQGLEFYKDTLIEGTGQYQKSVLRKNDYKTGKAYKEITLDGKYFGEGVTVFNNKIYQLTWRENTGFVYNAGNLNKVKDFTYFKQIEGWGLTHDDKNLYQSDGSITIYKLDPETLNEVSSVNVYAENRKVEELNELEWVDGKIYANVYQTNTIVVIDPATGYVEGLLDLTSLSEKITRTPQTDVLNGIAYNPKTKTFFVTGKLWDKMFEIRIK